MYPPHHTHPVAVNNLDEFLPLEHSAKQASLSARFVTFQGHGGVKRTGGISVFCICTWV